MKFVAMRELRNNTSRLLDSLAKDDVVITRNGKPAAAMVRLDEATLEEFILARNPKFVRELGAARKEFRKKGGISHKEMKKQIQRRG